MDSLWLTNTVRKAQYFPPGFCLSFHLSVVATGTTLEAMCSSIGGRYLASLDICFKGYTSRKSWADAFNDCIIQAPAGTAGRLAHVTSSEKWDIVKAFSDFWIGAKTEILDPYDRWFADQWNWYESPASIGASLAGGYYPSSPIIEDNENGTSCFRSKYENYKTEYCYRKENYVCEFFVQQTLSKCSSPRLFGTQWHEKTVA